MRVRQGQRFCYNWLRCSCDRGRPVQTTTVPRCCEARYGERRRTPVCRPATRNIMGDERDAAGGCFAATGVGFDEDGRDACAASQRGGDFFLHELKRRRTTWTHASRKGIKRSWSLQSNGCRPAPSVGPHRNLQHKKHREREYIHGSVTTAEMGSDAEPYQATPVNDDADHRHGFMAQMVGVAVQPHLLPALSLRLRAIEG